jgi:ATP-dependent DNA helicase Q1
MQISREIDSIDEQIASLKAARAILADDKQALLNRQKAAQNNLREKQRQVNHIKPLPSAGVVNYSQSSQFPWKKKLDGILDRVFGIKKLRLCQEGVLNAVLDGRDVICIMPVSFGSRTGGS